jgi:hypothetical protein
MGSNKQTLSQEEVEALFFKQGLRVLEPYINSRTRIKAQCLGCGKFVQPYYRQIWSGQRGCRDCSSNKFKLNQLELEETFQRLNLTLIDQYKNSKIPVTVKCNTCGSSSREIVANLRKMKTFHCAICYPKKTFVRKGRKLNPLQIREILEEFASYDFLVLGEFRTVNKSVTVKHLTCGTVSDRSLKSIKQGAGYCNGCRKNRILTEEEALKVLAEAGFEPIAKYINSEIPWESKCKKCGRILSPRLHTLRQKKSGCAYCNKVKVDPIDAVSLMISSGYTPLEPYKNSKAKWKSRHEVCGRIVFPKYNSIHTGQGGCPDCVDKYSYNEPSYFYVLENSLYESLKIGISNTETRDDRTLIHAKYGWKLIQRIDFENGFLAYEFEQTLLKYLRKVRKIPVHLSKVEMPQSGYSETMSKDAISLVELQRLVKDNQAGFLSN